jgi:hypothetical protein
VGGSTPEDLVLRLKQFGMIVIDVDSDGIQIAAVEQGRDPSI